MGLSRIGVKREINATKTFSAPQVLAVALFGRNETQFYIIMNRPVMSKTLFAMGRNLQIVFSQKSSTIVS